MSLSSHSTAAAMSLAALYEASVLSALTDLLSHIQPPSLTGQSTPDSGCNSHKPSPVSIRWPSLPASRQQLIDSLTLHDLLVLLIHAAILQHGATTQPQQHTPQQAAERRTVASTSQTQQPSSVVSSSPHSPVFIPGGWNSSRSGYRLRYTFSPPLSAAASSMSAGPSSAEVLTADSPIVYELRLLLLPMSHYLVIDAALHQVSAVDGASSAVSANQRLTLDVLSYVSVDELHGCIARWQDSVKVPQRQLAAPAEATDETNTLRLSAWVYRDVALLLTAVSNAIIKRCMGPLSPHSHTITLPAAQLSL